LNALDKAGTENLRLELNPIGDDTVFIDHLPNSKKELRQLYQTANKYIRMLE
jgi:hypothetical protein